MTGLLRDLDALLGAVDLGSRVGGQASLLVPVRDALDALTRGPSALDALVEAIAHPPGLPSLASVASLASGLEGVVGAVPADTSSPLEPLLLPLRRLAEDGLTASVGAPLVASLGVVRAVLGLATGRVFGGASGMPLPAALWGRRGMAESGVPDLAEVRACIAEAEGVLGALGDRLDAAAVLEWLRRASSAFARPSRKWPTLPVVGDTLEALQTVESWQAMDGPALTASLRRTLLGVAELVETPRSRVALPFVEAATTAGAGLQILGQARASLSPLLAGLRDKVLVTGLPPTETELRLLQAEVEALEALAAAVDPARTPLVRVDELAPGVERQMLRVVRAIHPGNDIAPLAARLRDWIGRIPAAEAEPMADLLATVRDLDVSVLTDPLTSVRGAVEDAVREVDEAKQAVRDALQEIVRPVDDALGAAVEALRLPEVLEALQALPGQVRRFVDEQVRPQVEPVRAAVSGAVDGVSEAVDAFDPGSLVAPIRDALERAAVLLGTGEVVAVFQGLDEAMGRALRALEGIDLAGAADESISRLGEVEKKLASIDPSDIPEASRPLLRQAVRVVTDVDFTGEVAAPLASAARSAVDAGPARVLDALDTAMAEVRRRVEAFRPSVVIGDALDLPFEDLLGAVRGFAPSQLLGRLADALRSLAANLGVLDVEGLVDPIAAGHRAVVEAVGALRPSRLMAPVQEAMERAVTRLFEVTGVDDLFDGLDDVVGTVRDAVGVLGDARGTLDRFAGMVGDAGDAEPALQALVQAAVARLDDVDLAGLGEGFAAVAAAVARVERDALAGELAVALRRAGERALPALEGADARWLVEAARGFPLAALRARRPTPAGVRLAALGARLGGAAATLAAARDPWITLSQRLQHHAAGMQERLGRYHLVTLLETGTVFDDLATPPSGAGELRAAVEAAVADALREPVSVLFAALRALAPHAAGFARGLSSLIDEVSARLDAMVGGQGVAGLVGAVEEAADLVRNVDLTPITDPLDATWRRIEGAVGALDPQPLAEALAAARHALADLLDLATLVPAEEVSALDATWTALADRVASLSPGAVVAETLDPVYDDLLSAVVPVLDLPGRLREEVQATGRKLGDDVVRELGRVEEAFDRMLRAIPVDAGPGGAVISATVVNG